MVLTRRVSAIALIALIALTAATSGAQRGLAGRGEGAGFGQRGSDGPRPVLLGFALECFNCTTSGRGRMGGGGRGAGPGAVWHYEEYPRIAAVMAGGVAQRAGIREGDMLLSVDGLSILSDEGAERFAGLRVGDAIHLTLDRAGKEFVVDLTLNRAMGRGGFADAAPEPSPSFSTLAHGTRVEIWSDSRVVESTDSTGATILKIGNTVVRLAGDPPSTVGRGRGRRGGTQP
jgi:membrane-associated protease RseP (regulator of RpoE activity)